MAKQNKPDIRFKGFTDAWEQRKAKELCNIGTGKSNTQDQVEDGIYPFYIRSDIPVKSNKYLYDCEAVITIGDGNIGRVFHYVNGKFDLHQRCYKMTDFQDIWGKYFYYFFSTRFYDRAMKMTAKATVDSVRLEMISEMDIWKPTAIDEQKKIAEFFANLDHLITLHQRKYDKLQVLKKAMLEKMFPKNGSSVPEIRFKGFTDAWEQRKLGALCVEFKSGDFISASDIAENEAYPVYGGNGLRGFTNHYNHDGEYALIGRQGALCGNVNYAVGKSYFTEHAVAVRANKTNQTRFLYYLFSTMNLGQYSGQSAQPGLAVGNLVELENVVPSKPEQEKIASFLSSLDHLITLHQRELEKLQNIKKSMLEKMFV